MRSVSAVTKSVKVIPTGISLWVSSTDGMSSSESKAEDADKGTRMSSSES